MDYFKLNTITGGRGTEKNKKVEPKRVIGTLISLVLIILVTGNIVSITTQAGFIVSSIVLLVFGFEVAEHGMILAPVFIMGTVIIWWFILQALGKVKAIQQLVYTDLMCYSLLVYLAGYMYYILSKPF